jgi:hypothetical protein
MGRPSPLPPVCRLGDLSASELVEDRRQVFPAIARSLPPPRPGAQQRGRLRGFFPSKEAISWLLRGEERRVLDLVARTGQMAELGLLGWLEYHEARLAAVIQKMLALTAGITETAYPDS